MGKTFSRHSPYPLSLLLVSIVLAAWHPAPTAAQTFEDSADVLEIQVPVNVVDKQGHPVRGLTAADFELIDNGKRQEIRSVEVIDLEVIQPGETRTEIERALPSAARRHFLLLFDMSFSNPSSVLRARRAAKEFVLSSLHPTDLAAVATHSVEFGSRLIVTFTPDRPSLARAIDSIGAPQFDQMARADPLRFIIDPPLGTTGDTVNDSTDFSTDGAVASLRESGTAAQRVIAKQMQKWENSFDRGRVSSWSVSMSELARVLNSVKGRKQVIFFSEGFDGRLMLGRQPSQDDPDTLQDLGNLESGNYWMVDTDDIYGNTGLQGEVGRMLEEFRRADCVLQTVDISGLRADTAAVERARGVGQDVLFYLANETGGSLYSDANNFGEQLDKVLERSSVTYVLSFQPQRIEDDGEYHRLQVKGSFPRGTKVSHRAGYYAPRPFEGLHPLEKTLLASDAIASATPARDLALNVLTAPFRASESEAYVPVIIEVGGQSLLAGHDEPRLPVELYGYVTNAAGEMKDFFSQLVTLDLTDSRDAFGDTGLKYYGHLDLGPGEYLIRVLVRNADTGRTGVETLPLSIPSYTTADAVLLPPFFLETQNRWFLVREQQDEVYQRSMVYPFTVNGQPYIPAARPALRSRDEAPVCLVAYNLGEGALELDGKVVLADGSEIAGGRFTQVERTITGIEGLDKLLVNFRPEGLEAGDYTLRVAVTNSLTGASQTNSIPFTLLN